MSSDEPGSTSTTDAALDQVETVRRQLDELTQMLQSDAYCVEVGRRVDVLNLSCGGNGEYPFAVLCRAVSPWCSGGASTGRPQGKHPPPQHLRMRLGRKATSHHDIDRLGVANAADESVHPRVGTSPPACAGQSLRPSSPHSH